MPKPPLLFLPPGFSFSRIYTPLLRRALFMAHTCIPIPKTIKQENGGGRKTTTTNNTEGIGLI
jgi:hypothetical protein